MDNLYKVQYLLRNVAQVKNQYVQIAEISGENFNIFKILKLTTREVDLHSAFIAELLNPKGSHGQKDIFLRLFVEHVIQNVFSKKVDFESFLAIVKVELYAGIRTEDSGGRIDIIITNNKNEAIIIENKIFASDQETQLFRYAEFGKRFNKFYILYLTLDGQLASELSSKTLLNGEHYFCISYKENILTWLKNCRKEAATQAMLRETISQYINIIKHLTGQSMNNEINNEILNIILKDSESIENSILLSSRIIDAKVKILSIFFNALKSKLIDKYPNLIENYSKDHFRDFFMKNKLDWGIQIPLTMLPNGVIFRIRMGWCVELEFVPNLCLNKRLTKPEFDFHAFNTSTIFNLVDSNKREQIINDLVIEIENLINEFIEEVTNPSKQL